MHSHYCLLTVAILALALHFPSSSLACEPDLDNHCEYYSGDMRKVAAEVNEFPWTVFVKILTKSVDARKSGGNSGCGGVIIDKKWILTSAHSVQFFSSNVVSVSIVAGAHNLMSPTLNEQTVDARSIIVHGGYNPTTLSNDIALIELNSALYFNEFVNSIPIQSLFGLSRFQGEHVHSGWGNVPCKCNRYWSDTLMKSNMTVFAVSESEIKAVGFVGEGDFGGPLISKFNWGIPSGPSRPGLVGIASRKLRMSDFSIKMIGGPVVAFTLVEHFVPWIKVYAYGDNPASFGTTYAELPAIKFTLTHNYTGVRDDLMNNELRVLSCAEQIRLVSSPILVLGIIILVLLVVLAYLLYKRQAARRHW